MQNYQPNPCRRGGGQFPRAGDLRVRYTRKSEDTDVPRAKIVPCFPSGTLKSDEQQSTVAERPLLPLAGSQYQALLSRTTGSWSWLRFACSVPHSPSTLDPVDSRAAGWRVSQVRLRGCCAAVSLSNACFLLHGPCGLNFHFQCNEIGGSLPHTDRLRATCAATGSRFTRNLLTIPRSRAQGSSLLCVNSAFPRAIATHPSAPLTPIYNGY